LKIAHSHPGSVLGEYAEDITLYETLPFTGTAVIYTTLESGLLLQRKIHIRQQNIRDFAGCVTTDEDTVLGSGRYVYEAYVPHLAAGAFGGAFRETPACILMVAAGTRI